MKTLENYKGKDRADVQVGDILIETSFGFWVWNTVQYLIYLTLCVAVCCKMRGIMQKNNAITISIFAVLLFCREALYTFLCFSLSRGPDGKPVSMRSLDGDYEII